VKAIIVMPLAEMRGGAELALIQLTRHARILGVEWVVVFLEDGPMVDQIRDFGVKCIVMPAGRLRQFHRYLATVGKLLALIRSERPDAIVGWMGHAQLYGGLAGKLSRVPSMWFQLDTPNNYDPLNKIAMKLTDLGVITNSTRCYGLQKQYFPNTPVRLVYHGFDADRYDPKVLPTPGEARQQLGLPSDIPIIGLVGRLQRWKGIHTLIDCMPKVLSKYPKALCVIVGGRHDVEPQYEDFLHRLISNLSINENVLMAGLQRNVQIWMSAMDIIVHASDHEPFGIVVLEAMALGKPIVAGSEGGPKEIVTNGKNGVLTDYEDSDSLADAVINYLDNPEFAAKLGKEAQIRALDFTDLTYAVKFTAAVQDLLVSSTPTTNRLAGAAPK
jgi:glycosyltransferase involved in cell wall biosynthesis